MTSVTLKIGEKKMTSSLVRTTMMLCTDPIKDQLEKRVVKLLDNLQMIEMTKGFYLKKIVVSLSTFCSYYNEKCNFYKTDEM